MLETLAESEVLRHDDFPALYEIARRVANRNGAVFISLFDAAGRQIFNTLRPSGENLPTPFKRPRPDRPTAPARPRWRRLFVEACARDRAASRFRPVPRTRRRALHLHRQRPRDPGRQGRVCAERRVRPRRDDALLDRQFQGVPAVIFDRRGFIVGRWLRRRPIRWQPGATEAAGACQRQDCGVDLGTTLEGIAVYYAYARSAQRAGALNGHRARDARTRSAGGLGHQADCSRSAAWASVWASRSARVAPAALDHRPRAGGDAETSPPRTRIANARESADLERALHECGRVHARRRPQERESRLVARGAKGGGRGGEPQKDRFIAVLSHELRNPLAPIRNSI